MISYIIYRCQYEIMTENLSGPPQHSPHTLCEKFNLFVCQLILFGISLLNVNLGVVLGLGLVI